MSNEVLRGLLAGGRVRLEWLHAPSAVARMRRWRLRVLDEAGRGLEIDTGLTTVEGDRYAELVGRATVKTAACLLAMAGAEVVLPSGEVFDVAWVQAAVREVEEGE